MRVDQKEERPDGAQIRCVSSLILPCRRLPELTPMTLRRSRVESDGALDFIVWFAWNVLTELQSSDGNKLTTTTVKDYDLQETSKLMRGVYMGVAMMGFMHIYLKCAFSLPPLFTFALPPRYPFHSPLSLLLFPTLLETDRASHDRYTQPLFVQALMGLKTLYDAKPVAIHLFGKPAEGDLKRPFKAGGLMGGASPFLSFPLPITPSLPPPPFSIALLDIYPTPTSMCPRCDGY